MQGLPKTVQKVEQRRIADMTIQLLDLHRQYQAYKKDIDAQMADTIAASAFILGKKVTELEQTLAAFAGTKHAIGCASGTDALMLVLMTYDIRPGDEIITTPFTFIATAEVISLLKAKPVFVDINAETYNIDPKKIESAITDKTKGIIAVDIFGQCADYDEINAVAKKHRLFVIEDAAQAFGAAYKGRRACSLAETACTSFFPAKPLGCYGDGGMIFTDDDSKDEIFRSLRSHGMGTDKYDNVRIGLNSRLDTLQAAVLLAKFKHFPEEIKKRQELADYYTAHLTDAVITPKILDHNVSVFAQYCIRLNDRDRLQSSLKKHNIPTAIHYPKPLHLQSAFAYLKNKRADFPVAEKVSATILALPLHPFLERQEQDFIIGKINAFARS